MLGIPDSTSKISQIPEFVFPYMGRINRWFENVIDSNVRGVARIFLKGGGGVTEATHQAHEGPY